MAKHQYITGVLFPDESDSEEYSPNGFRSRIPRPLPKKTSNNNLINNNSNCNLTEQERQKQLIQKKQDIEKKTLESATRSLKLLHETEEIGTHAAKKLASQGEKLEKTNTRLDEIDSHLKQSQKDIKGIKSVFYGFKKIVSGKPHSCSPSSRCIPPHKKSPKIGKSKFYGKIDRSLQKNTKLGDFEKPSASPHSLSVRSSGVPSSHQVDDMLDANLEGIANHIAHLKILGVEFGKEIDHHNELIDIMHNKVERTDVKIGKQNKDMNKILRK